MKKAINQMSAGKAPGKPGIPAEIYKTAGPATPNAFHDIITSIWEDEDMIQDFLDASIVSLFKNKAAKLTVATTEEYHSCLLLGRLLPTLL